MTVFQGKIFIHKIANIKQNSPIFSERAVSHNKHRNGELKNTNISRRINIIMISEHEHKRIFSVFIYKKFFYYNSHNLFAI